MKGTYICLVSPTAPFCTALKIIVRLIICSSHSNTKQIKSP